VRRANTAGIALSAPDLEPTRALAPTHAFLGGVELISEVPGLRSTWKSSPSAYRLNIKWVPGIFSAAVIAFSLFGFWRRQDHSQSSRFALNIDDSPRTERSL
jgi:hypothetical protein